MNNHHEKLEDNDDSISIFDDAVLSVCSADSKSSKLSNLSSSFTSLKQSVVHTLRIDEVVKHLSRENPKSPRDEILTKTNNEINAHFIGDRARTRLSQIVQDDEQFRIFKQQIKQSGVTTTRGAKELVFACHGNK